MDIAATKLKHSTTPALQYRKQGRDKMTLSLRLSESEVLHFRYEIGMKYLCGVHYNDKFKKYVYWHNKKCADPCQRHARQRKTKLAVIELETARIVKNNP